MLAEVPAAYLTHVPAALRFMKEQLLNKAKVCLKTAQEHQRKHADLGRRPVNIEKGTMVMLSTRNLNMHMAAKVDRTKRLLPLWRGPFEVLEQVGPVAYRLKLPDNIHACCMCF